MTRFEFDLDPNRRRRSESGGDPFRVLVLAPLSAASDPATRGPARVDLDNLGRRIEAIAPSVEVNLAAGSVPLSIRSAGGPPSGRVARLGAVRRSSRAPFASGRARDPGQAVGGHSTVARELGLPLGRGGLRHPGALARETDGRGSQRPGGRRRDRGAGWQRERWASPRATPPGAGRPGNGSRP